jgi:hypothetical protein
MATILDLPPTELRDVAADARQRFEAMGAAPLVRQVDAVTAERVAPHPGASVEIGAVADEAAAG